MCGEARCSSFLYLKNDTDMEMNIQEWLEQAGIKNL